MAKRRQRRLQGDLWIAPPPKVDRSIFEAAMRDAADIRQWTDGPRPAPWRVYRLAQALVGPKFR